MLDIKFVREHPEIVKASEIKRGHGPEFLDNALKYDKLWREAIQKTEKLKHQRNVVSEEINSMKKAGKSADAEIKKIGKVADEIRQNDLAIGEYLHQRNDALMNIGNILDKKVPRGKDDSENVPIKFVGKPTKFKFPIKDHIEFGESLDLFEFDTAAKVAGARFVYFKNEAAILDLALQHYAVDRLVKAGFNMVWPPMMLNRAALAGGVNLKEFGDTIYKIEGEDLYLIGTSEHPLVALRKDQILEEKNLPIRVGGISACFRKEAGAHGRDTKGIFRMHQFNKIEQVMYCKPEDSPKYFDEMQKNAENMFKELGIPFRVVIICTGDLGNKQSLQYDIEAWLPGQNEKKGAYREVTSCSNCRDYQAVSLNTKFRKKNGDVAHVHMLNNTAIATPRAVIAILENFQQKDGSVKIPKALWKYTGFKEIKAKKK
jgi:seryl-tRNA synthetase